ncbi:hypothetical protein BH09SUM1_BH09SUM1_07770 [soil metagenome]
MTVFSIRFIHLRGTLAALLLSAAAHAQPALTPLYSSSQELKIKSESESEVIARLDQLQRTKAFSIDDDRTRFAIAERLAEIGSEKAIPSLKAMQAGVPATILIEACRDFKAVPAWPYPQAATMAGREIAVRKWLAENAGKLNRGEVDVASPAGKSTEEQGIARASLKRWASTLSSDDATKALSSFRKNSSRASIPPSLYMIAQDSPTAIEVAAMPADDALELIALAAKASSPLRERIAAALATRSDVRSAATIAGMNSADLRAELTSSEGAQIAAADGSAEQTEKLERAAIADAADPEARRHAIVALMLQGTPESRASLARVASDSRTNRELAAKIAGFLPR